MNHRGFLLAEETLKILIAVICIGFLVYFLFALYFNNQDKKDLELAKASLEHLVEQINAGTSEIEIYNPDEWVITSWPNDYVSGTLFWKQTKNGIPLSCSNLGWSSCICICKSDNPGKCDDKGYCLENTKGFMIENSVEIKNPPVILKINKESKTITR